MPSAKRERPARREFNRQSLPPLMDPFPSKRSHNHACNLRACFNCIRIQAILKQRRARRKKFEAPSRLLAHARRSPGLPRRSGSQGSTDRWARQRRRHTIRRKCPAATAARRCEGEMQGRQWRDPPKRWRDDMRCAFSGRFNRRGHRECLSRRSLGVRYRGH